MNKLERFYVTMCVIVSIGFGMGAHYGVKAGPPFPTATGTSSGHAYSPAARGLFFYGTGGSRSSGGSWGGGK